LNFLQSLHQHYPEIIGVPFGDENVLHT